MKNSRRDTLRVSVFCAGAAVALASLPAIAQGVPPGLRATPGSTVVVPGQAPVAQPYPESGMSTAPVAQGYAAPQGQTYPQGQIPAQGQAVNPSSPVTTAPPGYTGPATAQQVVQYGPAPAQADQGQPDQGSAGFPQTYQAAAGMQAVPAPPPSPMQDPNFAGAAISSLPLTPEMILSLRQRLDSKQRAAARPPTPFGAPARPVIRSVNVSLAPGKPAPIVQLAPNNVTSVVFVDSTGQPWPIATVIVGNSSESHGAFEVQVPVKDGNIMTIATLQPYAEGNVQVFLRGAQNTIPIMLDAGTERVDFRVDMRVGSHGPNAKALTIRHTDIPETGGVDMESMLDGVPPADAQPLGVAGVSADDVQAWAFNGEIFLRSRFPLISPPWKADSTATDGVTKIYEIVPMVSDRATSVIVAVDGQMKTVKLTER